MELKADFRLSVRALTGAGALGPGGVRSSLSHLRLTTTPRRPGQGTTVFASSGARGVSAGIRQMGRATHPRSHPANVKHHEEG